MYDRIGFDTFGKESPCQAILYAGKSNNYVRGGIVGNSERFFVAVFLPVDIFVGSKAGPEPAGLSNDLHVDEEGRGIHVGFVPSLQ